MTIVQHALSMGAFLYLSVSCLQVESKQGEYIGLDFNCHNDQICILDPQNYSNPQSIKGFLLNQNLPQYNSGFNERNFINVGDDTCYLNVHVLESTSSPAMILVAALQVRSESIIFIGQEHNCFNVTIDSEKNRPVKVTFKDDSVSDREPKIITPEPDVLSLTSTDFLNVSASNFSTNCVFCKRYRLCPQQVISVEFQYDGNFEVCVFNPENNKTEWMDDFLYHFIKNSSRVPYTKDTIINTEDDIHLISVRLMKVLTWDLVNESAFFLQVSNKTVLYLGYLNCSNMIYMDSKHRPIQFLLDDDSMCMHFVN